MRVLVVGAAVSGRAVLRLLDAEGHDVVVYDIDPAAVADLDPERSAAGEWDDRLLDEIDVMVPSPGVPEHSIPIQAALRRGIPIHSEIEVAAQRLGDTRLIAVTATNGKTTITEMASAMLTASGIPAAAVGNIGDPLSDAVGAGHEALVVETSSFQLRFIDTFHPDVAVLLNVAPDHLDWHGGLDAYRNAKARIHENQGEGDLLVYDEDDPGAVRAVSGARATRHPVSGRRRPSGGSGPAEGILFMGSAAMNLTRLHRLDEPFLVDLAAAGTAAIAVGADPASVISAAEAYRPGRHRRESIGTWRGITWVDDSKATNPHAAVASVRSYRSVVLIAGGRNKGLDLSPIGREPSVRFVVGIGESGPDVVAGARAGTVVDDLDAAVAAASDAARSGDVVLLAPGCASFDQFRSYGHRGDRFVEAVRAHEGDG